MSKKAGPQLTSWAHFRFSVIGGLLARPPERGTLKVALQELANSRYRHPITNEWVTFSFSTIERWYYQALQAENPIVNLGRQLRTDAGHCWAMSPQLLHALGEQYQAYPNWSYKLHADNLDALVEEQPELGSAPSYATVRRRMIERGWVKRKAPSRNQTAGQLKAQVRLDTHEVRSYESSHVHGLWHLDFHEGSRRIVDAQGQWHTPQLLGVLDDRSRVCCHLQWYLHENTDALIHGTGQAFHKRGLPRSLMSDRGAAMMSHEFQNGLIRQGIVHEPTLAYSPYQNGKQESFWGQIEGRLMPMLKWVEPLTLDFLNRATCAWVELEYNRTRHDEIKCTPLKRMLEGPDVSRPSPDSNTLRFLFTIQEKRTQRRSDGTLTIKGIRFEIPSRFRHMRKLVVRYQSWDLSMAYMVDERTNSMLAKIYPQDKTQNACARRRTLDRCEDQTLPVAVERPKDNPLPPLMRKLLTQYAATGLPPAYIPKHEHTNKEEHNDE